MRPWEGGLLLPLWASFVEGFPLPALRLNIDYHLVSHERFASC